MRTYVSLDEAWSLIKEHLSLMDIITIQLNEAVGCVLAEDYYAHHDFPPFKRSRMDGYALNAQSVAVGKQVRVLDQVPAGVVKNDPIAKGCAVEIMTGAPLPHGTDCVIKKEDCIVCSDCITIQKQPLTNQYVNNKGAEYEQGELLVKQGTELTGIEIGLLAMDGVSKVKVYQKPKIGIFSTGKELQIVGTQLEHGHIYNSNYWTISTELNLANYPLNNYGIVDDKLEALAQKLSVAVKKCNIVITTGGVAGSKYDLMADTIKAIDGKIIFWKLDVKPGTPILLGQVDKTLIICLSGNPPATWLGFQLIVLPILHWIQGEKFCFKIIEAFLQEELLDKNGNGKSKGLRHLYRGALHINHGMVFVKPVSVTRHGLLSSLDEGNCYIVVDKPDQVKKGELVKVLILGGAIR